MSHDYPLYLCTAGVLIVPDYNISRVLSSIDCALQMLQVLFLGGMLKKGLKTGGTFSMQLLHGQFLTLVIFNSDSVSMQFRKHLAF